MLELRLIIDSVYQEQITRFVKGKSGSKMNPFNPEELDIQCDFWYRKNGKFYGPETRYGFYYEEFLRDTSMEIEKWKWRRIGMKNELRVRFTPRYEGEWLCKTKVIINSKDTLLADDLKFNCISSDKKGYMEIADSRYFLVDGKPYLPIGNNLPHPKWVDDPNQLRLGNSAYRYELREMPIMPAAWVNNNEDIRNFAASGGNYFRMLLFPFANDIEFEHLNNYSNRMHLAWEMDQTIKTCEETGVKIHFDLTWANELKDAKYSYNIVFWDWYAWDYPNAPDDYGYCYQHELGLKEPHEFLSDERAIKFYKYKLRYIISRWGYSTSIGIVELMNEINLVFENYPRERMKWQGIMSDYLKNDLGLVQPIAVNYAGPPDIEKGDSSYYLKTVDVITFNEYRIPVMRSNFAKYLDHYSDINKPFMFSEIGAGFGHLNQCSGFLEWKKDAWMTSLSGLSSMGLEWHTQRDYELFKSTYPVIGDFVSKINLSDFEGYESNHRRDQFVELVAIKDKEGNRAAGVIQNTTWNYYTKHTNQDSSCVQYVPHSRYTEYVEVKGRKRRNTLWLTGYTKRSKLKLDYYNTSTGEVMMSYKTKSKRNGKVKIPYPDLKGDHNMLAFKIYPMGSNFSDNDQEKVVDTGIRLPVDNSMTE